ncbi:MAG: SDR family oxidoreductase [Fimbriimonadaceae bacterium]|nr:SDR family oxidoreductase [Alphaproteobacteria bacterium]
MLKADEFRDKGTGEREEGLSWLRGKTVFVTGGANGIGFAICRRFAIAGCSLVILDMDANAAAAAEKELRHFNISTQVLEADVSDYEQVQSGIMSVDHDIDILVNCAGWDRFVPFVQSDPGLWQKVLGINLFGALNTLHVILPQMISRSGGRIINVASDSGRVGASGEVSYSASKGGVIALTKAIAREIADVGITANVVCPGPTDTNMLSEVVNNSAKPEKLSAALLRAIPMRRLGKPEDIAGIVAFLASDEASYITGQVISASGGLTMSG